jgi:hypothetical protein
VGALPRFGHRGWRTICLTLVVLGLSAIIALSPCNAAAKADLAKVAAWTVADGTSGELGGTLARVLGYEGPVPTRQKAFQGNDGPLGGGLEQNQGINPPQGRTAITLDEFCGRTFRHTDLTVALPKLSD